jgi:N-acetylneuraminic acid mutarotase
VIVVAGSGGGSFLASIELYDPATNAWSLGAPMAEARNMHTATVLPSGKLLVVGGYGSRAIGLRSAELYDPVTNTWSAAASPAEGRSLASATLLANGKLLLAGGQSGSIGVQSAELYDPVNDTWSAAGSLSVSRSCHTATLLQNGKVLVAGGWISIHNHTFRASAELYDPAANVWSAAGSLADARVEHTATLLPDGRVLVAGGHGVGHGANDYLEGTELYDPTTNRWLPAPHLATAREEHTASLLRGGRVLMAGGFNVPEKALDSAELWSPDPSPRDQ